MNNYKCYVDKFREFYNEENIHLDEKLSSYIHFRVGGPADILLVPQNKEQLIKSIEVCRNNNIPFYLIGNGSNLLVKDGGFRGVIIKLTDLADVKVDGNLVTAECGVLLKKVSDKALENGLTGFEFACGIPGSVGGAVYMNAGAYHGEIADVIKSAEVLNDKGEVVILNKEELKLGYRTSILMEKGYSVISATFELEKGNKNDIEEKVNDLTSKREAKQPLEFPSAGSTFKRPEGYFAGKLIEDAGLKGKTIGGAAVSEKHSGFVINKGGATAKDVLDVIKYVQDEVRRQFGVDLHPEVRIIGED